MNDRQTYVSNLPLVTIIIATYNSLKVFPRTLQAIQEQTYPMECLEILVVDGGSDDGTCDFALKNGCIVLENPKTEPVNAKLIGLQNANGRYIIFIDHDEVMENKESIFNKVKAIQENKNCYVVLGSGYKRPKGYPRINQYISEFGDPFSLFLYSFPKYDKYLKRTLVKCYTVVKNTKDYFCVEFEKRTKEPLIELCRAGPLLDNEYFSKIPDAYIEGKVMTQLFYIMLQRGDTVVVCMKKDALMHYSADSIKAYFPKLKWRVCNNIHFQEMKESGVSGRLKYQKTLKNKRYLFMPYALFFLPAALHGIKMAVERKNAVYLLHPLFSFYVAVQIIWQSFIKLLGVKPRMRSYDGKKKI